MKARCLEVDPEIFFPERGGSSRAARAVCSQCEVRAECLLYALRNHEQFGIWGGTSERERRKLRRRASWVPQVRLHSLLYSGGEGR
ncbi:MAG: WhiB family transcriptional regulator [Actinomycetota bacterium]